MIHITFQSLYRGYGCVEVSFESCLSSKPSFLYCCCISRRFVSKTSVRTNTMLVIVFSLSVPCMIVYFYQLFYLIQPILKPYNEFSCMKVSATGFLVENLATGLEMRYIVFFLCPVNPSLEFGGYKRTVDAQVPVAFRFPFTYLCLHLGIH